MLACLAPPQGTSGIYIEPPEELVSLHFHNARINPHYPSGEKDTGRVLVLAHEDYQKALATKMHVEIPKARSSFDLLNDILTGAESAGDER
jgi:hypothetical protein